MAKPSITKRITKTAALTYSELDTNFQNLADATLTLRAGTGGTNVTADLNGTITLVAGTGVTLSGDNSAKTVTINSSSASNIFSTIAVAGQSNVVADSTSDTLTLVAGTNITLTTNSTTDTITINAPAIAGTVNTGVSGRIAYYPSSGNAVDDTSVISISAGTAVLGGDLNLNGYNISSGSIGNCRIDDDLYFTGGDGPVGNGNLRLRAASGSGAEVNMGTNFVLTSGALSVNDVIISNNYSGLTTIDRSGVTASYVNNDIQYFTNFSGMIMINRQDAGSGNVALWLCGGGSATKLGDSSSNVSGIITSDGAVNGYRWTNNTGGTITCSFMAFKGRASN